MFVATFSQTLGSQGGRAATAEEGEDQGEEEDERDGEKEDEEEAPGGEEERKEGDEGERRRREGRERRVRMRTTARMQEHGGSARAAFERAARAPPPESYYSYPFGMIDI
jgi:hypothetical protein